MKPKTIRAWGTMCRSDGLPVLHRTRDNARDYHRMMRDEGVDSSICRVSIRILPNRKAR